MAKVKSETSPERSARKAEKVARKEAKTPTDGDAILDEKIEPGSVKKTKKEKHQEKKAGKEDDKGKQDALPREAAATARHESSEVVNGSAEAMDTSGDAVNLKKEAEAGDAVNLKRKAEASEAIDGLAGEVDTSGAAEDVKKHKKARVDGPAGDVATNGEPMDVVKTKVKVKLERKAKPVGAMVPFADPIADEKVTKKVMKGVGQAAKMNTLARGVREVQKRISDYKDATVAEQNAVCILAGDISPMDVISHIPVFCEEHYIPYVYVRSRDGLGQAGLTSRPTSVVLVQKERKIKEDRSNEMTDEEKEIWSKQYKTIFKAVDRLDPIKPRI